MKRILLFVFLLNCLFSLSANGIAESGINSKFHGIWNGSITPLNDEEDNIESEKIKIEISSNKIRIYLIDNIEQTITYFNEDGERIVESSPDSTFGEWIEVEPITESIIFSGDNLIYNWINTERRQTVSGMISLIIENNQVLDIVYSRHIQGRYIATENYYGKLIKNVEQPTWVSDEIIQMKDGIMYSFGYVENINWNFERMERNAITYAQANAVSYLQNNSISYPIPTDARSRSTIYSTISINGNITNVQATFSDFKVLDRWIDSDGGIYILCSCTGVELPQRQDTTHKALEELDIMELLLYSLDLENQALELENQKTEQSE